MLRLIQAIPDFQTILLLLTVPCYQLHLLNRCFLSLPLVPLSRIRRSFQWLRRNRQPQWDLWLRLIQCFRLIHCLLFLRWLRLLQAIQSLR